MVAWSLAVGCTSPTPSTEVDAEVVDTGATVTDEGSPPTDTGPIVVDTGPIVVDTGPSVDVPVVVDTGPSVDVPVVVDTGPSVDVPVVVDSGVVDVTPPCVAGQTRCGGLCFDLQADRTRCGACDNTCATGLSCVAGVCALVCPSGQRACAGECRDVATDVANCGACGARCNTGLSCVAGACALVCPAGQSVCSDTCVDRQTDRRHCGACGMACEGGQVCAGGLCGAARACDDLLRRAPGTPSGSYIIDADGAGGRDAFRVYCDMTTDGGGWTLVAASVNETNMPRFDSTAVVPCISPSPSGPCFVGAANLAALALTEYVWSTETVAVGTRTPLENHREGVADTNATCVSSSEYYRLNQDSAEQGMGWTGCEPTELYNNAATCGTMLRPTWNLLSCDGLPVGPPGGRTSPDFNCSPFGRYTSACMEFRNMRHWRRGQACPSGQVNCGGFCRATQHDLNHCGACGNACGAGQSCVAGACAAVTSCADLLRRQPGVPSGTYRIDPDGADGAAGFPVYCDMVTDGGGWTLVAAAVGETNMPRFTNNAVAPCVAATPNGPCFLGRAALAALTFTSHAWSTGPTAANSRAPLDGHLEGAAAVNATCTNSTEYFRLNQDIADQGMGWTGCEPTEIYSSTATCGTMFRPAWNLLVCDGIAISPGPRTSPDFNCSPFGRYNTACNGFRNIRHWRR